jgi:hypothetical protein
MKRMKHIRERAKRVFIFLYVCEDKKLHGDDERMSSMR